MIVFQGQYTISVVHDWLMHQGYAVGVDYHWAWHLDNLAVEFKNKREEIKAILCCTLEILIMENKNRWILTIDEDPETGDGILTFPPELLESTGWKEGDTLHWSDNKDGSWTLSKKDTA
jgi:hypothetical protein